MEQYTFLRELADSWVLLAMFSFFIGMILFLWRRGSAEAQTDAATLPFRNDHAPLSHHDEAPR